MNREPKVNIKYDDDAMVKDKRGLQYKLRVGGSYGTTSKSATKGKRAKSLKSRANRRKGN